MKRTCLCLTTCLVLTGLSDVVAGPGHPPPIRRTSSPQKKIPHKADKQRSGQRRHSDSLAARVHIDLAAARVETPQQSETAARLAKVPPLKRFKAAATKVLGAIRLRRPLKESIQVEGFVAGQEYNAELSDLPQIDEMLVQQNVPPEKRARILHHARHQARMRARLKMLSPQEVAQLEQRDLENYGHPDGPTFEQMVEKYTAESGDLEAAYQAIIEASRRTVPAAKAPSSKGEVVSSTGSAGSNRAKTLVDELKKQNPAIRKHLEALESGGVKIDLVKNDPAMQTDAYFNAPGNTVRISHALDGAKTRDQILFESCNALYRSRYQAMEDGVKNGTMSLREYGIQKASTEFLATMKYAELLVADRSPEEKRAFSRALRGGTSLPDWTRPLSPLALRQLRWAEVNAPGYLEQPNKLQLEQLKQSFLAVPHDAKASPYTAGSLPTPELYAFEEIGRKTAGGLRNTLLVKFYPLSQTEMNEMGEKGKALARDKKELNVELTKLLPNSLDNYSPKIASRSEKVGIDVLQPARVNAFIGALDSLSVKYPQFSEQLRAMKPSAAIQSFVNGTMVQINAFTQNPGNYTIVKD